MDTFLFLVTALATTVASALGFFVATRPPTTATGWYVYEGAFVATLLIGLAATYFIFQRSQADQARISSLAEASRQDQAKIAELIKRSNEDQEKIAAVVGRLEDGLLGPKVAEATPSTKLTAPAQPAPLPEAERIERARVITQLRDLYVLSHDNITSEMMAGLQLPPIDWLNQQLEKYKKTWRVKSVDGPNFATFDL